MTFVQFERKQQEVRQYMSLLIANPSLNKRRSLAVDPCSGCPSAGEMRSSKACGWLPYYGNGSGMLSPAVIEWNNREKHPRLLLAVRARLRPISTSRIRTASTCTRQTASICISCSLSPYCSCARTRGPTRSWRRVGPAFILSPSSTEQQQDYGVLQWVWRMPNGLAAFASPHLELRDGAGEMLRLDPGFLPRFRLAVGGRSCMPWRQSACFLRTRTCLCC
ncbi:hypothetical protein HDV57DRAFT_453403 [Trichoderma longibrachiatum]